jgi:hypothetical protein
LAVSINTQSATFPIFGVTGILYNTGFFPAVSLILDSGTISSWNLKPSSGTLYTLNKIYQNANT